MPVPQPASQSVLTRSRQTLECIEQVTSLALSGNKHCSKISQDTLRSVSDDLLLFVIGQKCYNFTLLRVKDAMLFQHCHQAIQVLCTKQAL
jgi:hypothetical protein